MAMAEARAPEPWLHSRRMKKLVASALMVPIVAILVGASCGGGQSEPEALRRLLVAQSIYSTVAEQAVGSEALTGWERDPNLTRFCSTFSGGELAASDMTLAGTYQSADIFDRFGDAVTKAGGRVIDSYSIGDTESVTYQVQAAGNLTTDLGLQLWWSSGEAVLRISAGCYQVDEAKD